MAGLNAQEQGDLGREISRICEERNELREQLTAANAKLEAAIAEKDSAIQVACRLEAELEAVGDALQPGWSDADPDMRATVAGLARKLLGKLEAAHQAEAVAVEREQEAHSAGCELASALTEISEIYHNDWIGEKRTREQAQGQIADRALAKSPDARDAYRTLRDNRIIGDVIRILHQPAADIYALEESAVEPDYREKWREFKQAISTHDAALVAEKDAEIARLRAAIMEHRNQKQDDRCWLDDHKLYLALGANPHEPIEADLPPREVFLSNCARYWECRKTGTTYERPEDLDRLLAEAKRQGASEYLEAWANETEEAAKGASYSRSSILAHMHACRARAAKLREPIKRHGEDPVIEATALELEDRDA